MLNMFKMDRKELAINAGSAALSALITAYRSQGAGTTTDFLLESLKFMGGLALLRSVISACAELADMNAAPGARRRLA